MKIAINRKPISGPWGGGNNFVKAVYDSKPSGVEITNDLTDDVSVIFLMDPRKEGSFDANDALQFSKRKKVQLVQRINECDARKGTEHMDNMLLQCSSINTKTIFVSNWMKNYFSSKGWACKNQHVLHNGVDNCFFFSKPDEKSNKTLKIVTHHWSNNYLKGFDVYEFIDYLTTKDNTISFTYIGRDRGSFSNSTTIAPLHGKDLAEELSKYDVYISASRFDPGPNHVLEALAVGLPTYVHKDGGGAVEFVDPGHVYRNLFDVEKLINQRNFQKNSKKPTIWNESMKRFWSIMLDNE